MSKKTVSQLPNIILVSQDHTNGLFHNVNDLDMLVDVLLEHIHLVCFTETDLPEMSSIEQTEKYVGDFAMWKIVCKPNLQFIKQEALLSHQELYEFVQQGRKSLTVVDMTKYSFTNIDRLSQDLIELRNGLKDALSNYIAVILKEAFDC